MSLVDFVHGVVTGSRGRRMALTAVGFTLFSVIVIALVLGALWFDAWLGLGPLVPASAGLIVGLPVFGLGVLLVSWCFLIFRSARGTPVPFNPPRELVVRGPYLLTRNPMLTGLLASLVGAGFVLRSPTLVFGVVPIMVVGAYIELKLVEEPELRRRFGDQYVNYSRHVPMFVPRSPRR